MAQRTKETPEKKRLRLVDELLGKIEEKLSKGPEKVTLADYIRLVQLKKEMEEDEPREIRVGWVENETPKSENDG
jgi:hypothetical protein